jgi:arylsulfatase A-like enzyme
MVYPKKFPQNTRIQQSVQLLDIMPTILDMAKIKKDNLLIEGDSLVSIINGGKVDFWNSRFCISEEVKFKRKEDTSVYGSIFYKNWHILNSDKLNDTISYKIKNFSGNLYDILQLETRVFNLSKDKSEHYDLMNFLFDVYFNYKVQTFLEKYRNQNLITWKILTKDTDQKIKYDPAALKQLRSLGYIK